METEAIEESNDEEYSATHGWAGYYDDVVYTEALIA